MRKESEGDRTKTTNTVLQLPREPLRWGLKVIDETKYGDTPFNPSTQEAVL